MAGLRRTGARGMLRVEPEPLLAPPLQSALEHRRRVKIRPDIFVDTGTGGCYLFSMKVRVLE